MESKSSTKKELKKCFANKVAKGMNNKQAKDFCNKKFSK